MTEERLKLGAWGEEQAVHYLKGMGAKIIARNFRAAVGEIDIIARLKKQILFVEVKTRSSLEFGSPADAVGLRKQRQIINAARWYLQNEDIGKLQPRFDVVSVLNIAGRVEVEYYPAAFEL